ncbi:hypothetical protein SAMN05443144_12169 [Fodinibius roseus]|uniref:Uncharacterized protein n=1 Tax=Fodinibius roseus TaxID=1194090 RepID=A0A1M5HYG5_9BACT|nr:hypothetical protein [Fodinibius roseus]SHG20937.1 hypothetical protein SAMN05443144_12169 [Fodinibius roseus]
MTEKDELLAELREILEEVKVDPPSKYLSAKRVEIEYGISAKTILNRSNLPVKHKRYIPSVHLKGGRKKYFERKVIERLIKHRG